MKLTRLLAAIGICSLFAIPASAEPMDIIYNDQIIEVDADIINDRTMITPDGLEALGISVYAEGGFWDIKKGDVSFYYDDITKTISGTAGEVHTDVMPIITSNRQNFPLRTIAEYLGIAVGWDSYENAVVLIDLLSYFEEFKEKSPELYEFLALEMKNPQRGKGNSDISVNLEFPDFDGNKSTFKLKLIESNAALDNLATTSMTLEELLYSDSEYNYVLSDVTLDGIFDIDTMTIYFKTNAVKKIYDSLPEDSKDEMAAITQLFADEVWYKLSMKDYMAFVFETVLGAYEDSEYTSQMTDFYTKMYEEGMTFGELYSVMTVNEHSVNDIYAFEYIQEMFDAFKLVFDSGWMKVETIDATTKKLVFDVTVDSIIDFSVKTSEQYGYTPTQEEIAEMKAEFNEMLGNSFISGGLDIVDGIPVNAGFKMDFRFEDGYFNMEVNSKFDTQAEVGEIVVPADVVDLMPMIKTMTEYSEAV